MGAETATLPLKHGTQEVFIKIRVDSSRPVSPRPPTCPPPGVSC